MVLILIGTHIAAFIAGYLIRRNNDKDPKVTV